MPALHSYSFAETLGVSCCFNGSGLRLIRVQETFRYKGEPLCALILSAQLRCKHCKQVLDVKERVIPADRSMLGGIRDWLKKEATKTQQEK